MTVTLFGFFELYFSVLSLGLVLIALRNASNTRNRFFYHISKHLKVLENYDFRTRHVLNFLLGVWICCKIWTLVIHYLIRKLPFALVFVSENNIWIVKVRPTNSRSRKKKGELN